MKRFIEPQTFLKLIPKITTGASQPGPNAASLPAFPYHPLCTLLSPSTPGQLTVYAMVVPSAFSTRVFPFPLENAFSSFSMWLCCRLPWKALSPQQAGLGASFLVPRHTVFIPQHMASCPGTLWPSPEACTLTEDSTPGVVHFCSSWN